MNSRGSKRVDLDTWSRLVALPHALLVGGDWLRRSAVRQRTPPPATELRAAVDRAGGQVVAAYADVATQLAVSAGGRGRRRSATAARAGPRAGGGDAAAVGHGPDEVDRARSQLAHAVSDGSARAVLSDDQVVALVWTTEWLALLRDLNGALAGPMRQVDEALQRSWWR